MGNEEQIADTIEMLYERLHEYHKQDLFNYGYLLESNQNLIKDIEEKDKEIKRLNNIINELEKDLEDIFYGRGQHFIDSSVVPIKYVLNKLKKLKEGKE